MKEDKFTVVTLRAHHWHQQCLICDSLDRRIDDWQCIMWTMWLWCGLVISLRLASRSI